MSQGKKLMSSNKFKIYSCVIECKEDILGAATHLMNIAIEEKDLRRARAVHFRKVEEGKRIKVILEIYYPLNNKDDELSKKHQSDDDKYAQGLAGLCTAEVIKAMNDEVDAYKQASYSEPCQSNYAQSRLHNEGE